MANVNLDISQTLNITCRKNDTFFLDLVFSNDDETPIDLTAYTFKMQIRRRREANTSLLDLEGTTSFPTQNANGELRIFSQDIDLRSGSYVYDLQATHDADQQVITWLAGSFTINDDVTE